MCGRGRAGLKATSWFLGFCPLIYRAFSEYNSPLHQIVQQSAINSQLVVPSQLHSLHDTEPKNVVDVTVMCDGTWSRRGFTAMVVISWNSGHLVKERIHGNGCDIVEFRPGMAHYTKMLFYFIEGRCSAIKGSSTCIHLEYQILSYFSFFLHVYTGIENKRPAESFPALAQGPSNYNSGAHAHFQSPHVRFFVEVFGCLLHAITVRSAGTRIGLDSVGIQEGSQKEVRNFLQ